MNSLFSNFQANGNQLNHNLGKLITAIALTAGTIIGAGILALPTVTYSAGVIPSTITLTAVWIFMVTSMLLLAEINLKVMYEEGNPNIGLLTIIKSKLGKIGTGITVIVFLFLHYASLVAYISHGGGILVKFINKIGFFSQLLPHYIGTITFVFLFGGIVYFNNENFVKKINNLLLLFVLISFLLLLSITSHQVDFSKLMVQNWLAIKTAIPIMVFALLGHSIVPVINHYLEGHKTKIFLCIIIGTGIPFILYLLWNAVILMNHSLESNLNIGKIFDPLESLRQGAGGEKLGILISFFSEFAIVTSFIGFIYALLNFFMDALNQNYIQEKNSYIYALIFIPPLIFSSFSPGIFLTVLNSVGTFGVSILFGIIPIIVAWKQRYHNHNQEQNLTHLNLVPGGKIILVIMAFISVGIIAQEILI